MARSDWLSCNWRNKIPLRWDFNYPETCAVIKFFERIFSMISYYFIIFIEPLDIALKIR